MRSFFFSLKRFPKCHTHLIFLILRQHHPRHPPVVVSIIFTHSLESTHPFHLSFLLTLFSMSSTHIYIYIFLEKDIFEEMQFGHPNEAGRQRPSGQSQKWSLLLLLLLPPFIVSSARALDSFYVKKNYFCKGDTVRLCTM